MTGPRRPAQPIDVVHVDSQPVVEAVEVERPDPLAGAELVAVRDRPHDPDQGQPSDAVRRTDLGTPNGVATLGADGLLSSAQRPDPTVAWFEGDGPPGVLIGSRRGDMYLDRVAGELYQLK